jgi:hypothetical protein
LEKRVVPQGLMKTTKPEKKRGVESNFPSPPYVHLVSNPCIKHILHTDCGIIKRKFVVRGGPKTVSLRTAGT